MKALTAAEMREVDRLTTERYGVPSLELMENAGTRAFEFLRSAYGDVTTSHASVLCGKGNNGGDGFVAARLLQEAGLKPRVYLFAEEESVRGEAAENLLRLKKAGAAVQGITDHGRWETAREEVAKSRVIVDALLGTGLKGKVEGLLASVIEDVNQITREATAIHPQAVVAVDTPSGLPSDCAASQGPVICAHATVTFTAPKLGQLVSRETAHCGKLLVREIGSPAALIKEVGKGNVRWIEPREFRNLPLVRRVDAHKGSYGHVLVVAGSRGKSGAAILAGRGALRAGAGLVTIATPEEVLPIVAGGQAEVMTEPLRWTGVGTISSANLKFGRFGAVAKGKSVLAIGPGIGTHGDTQRMVRGVVKGAEQSVVLDADGLNAFAGHAAELAKRKQARLAVTPHPGEMARLLGMTSERVQADRLGTALKAAAAWKSHVILKGFHTILATPEGRAFVNTTGNAGMAKGGSGDVLTGILGGLASQFGAAHWEQALMLGIYLHGRAGEDATVGRSEAGLLAGEIADTLPVTYHRLIMELRELG